MAHQRPERTQRTTFGKSDAAWIDPLTLGDRPAIIRHAIFYCLHAQRNGCVVNPSIRE